jgi:hypothetical protein
LFSLLHKIFQVKILSKEKKKLLYNNNCFLYNNLLTLFLSQIYLSPLDNYAKNLSKEYIKSKQYFEDCIPNKLTFLTKKKIIPLLSYSLSTQPELTKPNCYKDLPLSHPGIYIKIKHVRYANDFIFGILGNKK